MYQIANIAPCIIHKVLSLRDIAKSPKDLNVNNPECNSGIKMYQPTQTTAKAVELLRSSDVWLRFCFNPELHKFVRGYSRYTQYDNLQRSS